MLAIVLFGGKHQLSLKLVNACQRLQPPAPEPPPARRRYFRECTYSLNTLCFSFRVVSFYFQMRSEGLLLLSGGLVGPCSRPIVYWSSNLENKSETSLLGSKFQLHSGCNLILVQTLL